MSKLNQNNYYLTESKCIFLVSMVVIPTTIIGVWLFGIGEHRSIFVNSLLSTSILSVLFFLFITIGLYLGIRLKNNIDDITNKIDTNIFPDLGGLHFDGAGTGIGEVGAESSGGGLSALGDLGDEIGAIILAIFAWLIAAVVIFFAVWIFGAVLWICLFSFIAMLYWIFFRALKLVFKNSTKCKNDLLQSSIYGVFYTILYNFWIYALIYGAHLL